MFKGKVVITGMGVITPLGNSIAELWNSLINGKNGISSITKFDAGDFPVRLAAEVRDFEPADYIPIKRVDRTGRCAHFALAAASMAIKSAKLEMPNEKSERVGVVIGTNGMPNSLSEQQKVLEKRGPMRVDPLIISKYGASMIPGHIGLEFGARGPNTSVNSYRSTNKTIWD